MKNLNYVLFALILGLGVRTAEATDAMGMMTGHGTVKVTCNDGTVVSAQVGTYYGNACSDHGGWSGGEAA
jgi:hypothetical protein